MTNPCEHGVSRHDYCPECMTEFVKVLLVVQLLVMVVVVAGSLAR